MSNDTLATMVRQFRELRDRKDELKSLVTDNNKALKNLAEQILPEYMEENEIDKITIEGAGTVFVKQELYASVLAGDREALYEWLRDTGNEDLVKDWVFPATLTAFCKDQLEYGKPVPEMVKATKIPTAILRRN